MKESFKQWRENILKNQFQYLGCEGAAVAARLKSGHIKYRAIAICDSNTSSIPRDEMPVPLIIGGRLEMLKSYPVEIKKIDGRNVAFIMDEDTVNSDRSLMMIVIDHRDAKKYVMVVLC